MNPLTDAITRALLTGPGIYHPDGGPVLVYVVLRKRHALALSRYAADLAPDEIAQAVAAITRRAHIAPDRVERFDEVTYGLHVTRLEWHT